MTDEPKSRRSLAHELEETRPLDSAAADAAIDAVVLMNRTVEDSGLRNSDLAAALGVTNGRVSQILNGDGNVRVSTLARVLRAAGVRLKLEAEPCDARGTEAGPQGRGRRRARAVSPVFIADRRQAEWTVSEPVTAHFRTHATVVTTTQVDTFFDAALDLMGDTSSLYHQYVDVLLVHGKTTWSPLSTGATLKYEEVFTSARD